MFLIQSYGEQCEQVPGEKLQPNMSTNFLLKGRKAARFTMRKMTHGLKHARLVDTA